MSPTACLSAGPELWKLLMAGGFSGSRAASENWFSDRPGQVRADSSAVFDIRGFFNVLQRSRRLIALTVATTTVLALAAGVMQPRRYSAAVQVFVDSRGLKLLANELSPQAAAETAIADFESQLKILISGAVLLRVAERERLASDPTFLPQPGLMSRLRALLPGDTTALPDRNRAAAAILERSATLRRADRSFVVDVVVSDSDPQRAARLANAIAEVYLENRSNNRRDLAKRLGGEVGDRLQDLRERMESAEKRLNDFKSANNLVYSGGSLVNEQDLTELNNQLNQARARTARAKARLDQLARLGGNTGTAATIEVLDSPTIVQLRVRLAEASRQAAELRRNLGPLHPDIQAAEARVREANSAISGEVERRRSSIRNDYEQALAGEKVLARQITDLKNKSSDVGQSLIALRELERAVEANKKIYEEFMLRSRELAEQQGIFANASYVITPASAPSQANGLSMPLILVLGFFAGFPIGIGLAVLRAQLEPRPGDEDGHVSPAAADHANTSSRPAHAARQPRSRTAIEKSELDEYLAQGALRRVRVPSDAISDFTQTIENAMPAGSGSVLLVASATPQASGASISAALAACWAYDGYDVLAVDADPVEPRLARLANLESSPGLFDRLHKPVEGLVHWNGRGLPHMLGGLGAKLRQPVNGARRIVAARIEELAASADTLVLDAGDIAANDYAAVLLQAAHAAIVVAEQSADGERQARETIALLERAGVNVAGYVMIAGERETPAAPPVPASPLSIFRRRKRDASAADAAAAVRRR